MQPFSKMPSVQTECGGGKLRNSCVAINPDPTLKIGDGNEYIKLSSTSILLPYISENVNFKVAAEGF